MPNSLWQIAFGPYTLSVDRRTLRFDLRDIKAGIDWAENLSLGWIELQERETGDTTRHDFGDCSIVSVAEKAGAQGKRILFGLDAPGGVPIDVYVICTEREIQLTVEASRDTKTHRVVGFGLVPGLVSVPDDGASYLVRVSEPAVGTFARDVPERGVRYLLTEAGRMPFFGAVRARDRAKSIMDAPAGSLGLITDSVYAYSRLYRQTNGGAVSDLEYERDPERRRLDVRIVVLPGENHVGIARAYRDKIIGEKNHVTLRRKIRERPNVEKLIGAAWISHPARKPTRETWGDDYLSVKTIELHDEDDYSAQIPEPNHDSAAFDVLTFGYLEEKPNRWEAMEEALQQVTQADKLGWAGVGLAHASDWAFVATDFLTISPSPSMPSFFLPLCAVVYHDALVFPARIIVKTMRDFHFGLLHLSPPLCDVPTYPILAESRAQRERHYARNAMIYAVLGPLHRLTFSAFLTSHRFLTPDALVEDAEYSDKTHIVINRSTTDTYETPDLHLPPGGFWVRHGQMEAHDALRVGGKNFEPRAFRIRRALDGKPLELSADVETREFPVEPV